MIIYLLISHFLGMSLGQKLSPPQLVIGEVACIVAMVVTVSNSFTNDPKTCLPNLF